MDDDLWNFDDLSIGGRPLARSPSSGRTRLIVGIDFGTTFSGASFTLLHRNDNPENAKVTVVRNWKGHLPGNTTSNKVPTEIAYDDDGTPFWGFDIPDRLAERNLRWLKLLLEPDIHSNRAWPDAVDPKTTARILKTLGKTAVEAASDYVRLLWQHVKAQIINDHSQTTYDFAEKIVVLTVPAVWSEKAKHNTYLVALGAGLASESLQLQTCSEPEAAAIAILKDRGSLLQANDCYVVVDAGGGTVDLTSYLLTSTSPIVLEELISGDGDVCGAVFLEVGFRNLLRTYLGNDTLRDLPAENIDRIINDFQNGVRKFFDGEDSTNYMVTMPGVREEICDKIRAGILRLNAADLHPVFMPVIKKVERLVRKQVEQLRKMDRNPRAILLVGGFGMNAYLAKRLKDTYETSSGDGEKIEVLQPDIGWESIASGAVRCEALGIGNVLSFRIARYSVGYSYNGRNFDEAQDNPDNLFKCELDGLMKVKRIHWYLTRGERIKPGQRIDMSLNFSIYDREFIGAPTDFCLNIDLHQCKKENPPRGPSKDTRRLVRLNFPWDLKAHPMTAYSQKMSTRGLPYRKILVVVTMRQGPSKMEFEYSVGGEMRGAAQSVEFQEAPAGYVDSETEDLDDETLFDGIKGGKLN